MQSIEKALHQPMPFTTGGQTITDRLTAARHALAGSQLGKTICKATTEELVAPKKKHLDYLLHCTNEPNVSIPSMANLLIERTQNPNWVVVYKALITIHNVMCYGNERFSQYLASCNTTFNLTNFLDKSNPQGYDMSNHVRRYGKYISEKIYTYRLCAFDFCKIKRGREDGVLRVMHTDKLLKTLPILQNQMDALLEFQVTSGELNNGVINCSFILLFRDLIRLFACYNDGVINLLEKFFDMNKKQAREAFDLYKSFLLRLDKVAAFLSVAESVGVDRGEIPDLTRAPASLVDALEAHLHHLEGGKGPLPSSVSASQQIVNQQLQQSQQQPTPLTSMSAHVDDSVRQRYIEEEKERLRQYEEQRQKQLAQQPQQSNVFNPFAPSQPIAPSGSTLSAYSAPSNDPPLMFTQPQQNITNAIPHSDLLELYKQPQSMVDPTNPFANFTQPQSAAYGGYPGGYGNPQPPAYSPYGMPQQQQQQQQPFSYSQIPSQQSSRYNSGILNGPPLNSSTTNGFKDYSQQPPPMIPPQPQYTQPQQSFNPFAMNSTPVSPQMQQPSVPQQQQQVQQMTNNPFAAPVSNFTPQSQPLQPPNQSIPISSTGQALGIYDQTPFSGNDSSYTSPSHFQQQMEQTSIPTSGGITTSPGPPRPPPPVSATPPTVAPMPAAAGSFDPFATANISNIPPKQADINSTLSNLVDNMEIAGKNPAWMTPPGTTAPTYGQPSQQSSQSNPFNPFG